MEEKTFGKTDVVVSRLPVSSEGMSMGVRHPRRIKGGLEAATFGKTRRDCWAGEAISGMRSAAAKTGVSPLGGDDAPEPNTHHV